jgi:hypothetical protein
MHARTISIKDPRHFDAELVLALIVEEQGLGATFAFVIAGARPNWIDVAPIVLGLRVNGRITIDLRRGGLQNLCFHALSQPKHVDGAVDAGLGRLNGGRTDSEWVRQGRRDYNFRRLQRRVGSRRRGA